MRSRWSIASIPLAFCLVPEAYAQSKSLSDRISVDAEIGIQGDTNITVSDSDVESGQGDVLGVFDSTVTVELTDNLEVGYGFFQTLHQDLTEFNLQSQNGFAFYNKDVGPISLGLGYQFFFTRLGGEDFLSLNNIRPTAGFFLADPLFVNLHADYTNKNFLGTTDTPLDLGPDDIPPPDIQGRDADTVGFGGDAFYFYGSKGAFLSIGYRYEIENASDPQFDFVGNLFGIDVSQPLPIFDEGTKLKLSYDFSDRNYGSITPSIGAIRDDTRQSFGITFETPLLKYLRGEISYAYVASNSNLPSVDFTNSIFSAKLGVKF